MSYVIGYARVSTAEQEAGLAAQLRDLEAAGAKKIFQERLSGKDTKRPQLAEAIAYLREGDVLICTKLDRLARSVRDLYAIVEQVKAKGASVRILDGNIDTSQSNPFANAMMGFLAVMAQFEREIMLERQKEGIAAAQKKGRFNGRPATAKRKAKEATAMLDAGESTAAVAAKLGISERSVYRLKAAREKAA